MNPYQLFPDLPDIQLEEHSSLHLDNTWPAHNSESRYNTFESGPVKLVNVYGTHIPLAQNSTQEMTSLQRYFYGPEKPPFTTELFNTYSTPERTYFIPNPDAGLPYKTQIPWPSADEYRRQSSPEGTIMSSSSWSGSPHDDLRACTFTPRLVDRSPSETRPLDIVVPEPTNYNGSLELTFGGGSCTLSQIQQVPDEISDDSVDGPKYDYQKYDSGYQSVKTEVTEKDDLPSSCDNHDGTESLEDAELSHYIRNEDSSDDSEYKPSVQAASKRSRTRGSQNGMNRNFRSVPKRHLHNRTSSSSSVQDRVLKKKPRLNAYHGAQSHGNIKGNSNGGRHFPCPFAIYSCLSSFSSKNEWKRHVSTQHIRLGFWRCDLCPTTMDATSTTTYYNDFNRKDLFTQHLRRMHCPPHNHKSSAKQNAKDYPATEETLKEHQGRCYHRLRSPPPQSSCLYCNQTFQGLGSWDERMEHIGRHLEQEKKTGGESISMSEWVKDDNLRQWLLNEGLIDKDGRGGWRLGDGNPRRRALSSNDNIDDCDSIMDGEGEEE